MIGAGALGNIALDIIRTQGIVLYDDFNDNAKDTDIWDTDTIAGSTTISEASRVTRFANLGTGAAGYSDRPSIKSFGKSMVIEADLVLTTGTGTSNEAFIELYKDANNYFRFGFYRSAGTDSRGRIVYKIAGGSVVTTDVDTVDTDAISRNYRIIVDEHNVQVYLERQLLATIAFEQLTDYIVRMEAGTTGNTDTLEVDFNNVHVYSYWEHDLETHRRIESIQGGSESIQTLWNQLADMLDLARSGDSGSTVMTGAEQTLYEYSSDRPFAFHGGSINFTGLNSGAGENTLIKISTKNVSGGAYAIIWQATYLAAAVPTNPMVIIPNGTDDTVLSLPLMNIYGVKVTATQGAIGGGWNTLVHEWLDSAT